jgi:hypothetical protein
MANNDSHKVSEILDTTENRERIAKFEQMATEDDAKRKIAAKIFNPVELMRRASEIRELEHPALGTIRFGELTLVDSDILRQCKNDADKTAMALYLMLKKAYPQMPTFTSENISEFYRTFPMAEGAELLKLMSEQPAFLQKVSTSGSVEVGKRKKSA